MSTLFDNLFQLVRSIINTSVSSSLTNLIQTSNKIENLKKWEKIRKKLRKQNKRKGEHM